MVEFNVAKARDNFPALSGKQVYLDNAGGSQILKTVAESIYQYLTENNVQLGASYNVGQLSTKAYNQGYEAAAKYINASPKEVVIGSSTTQLYRNLSHALTFEAGDEVILSKLDHEANLASWLGLAERQKLEVKWWSPSDSKNPKLEPEQLDELLSKRTRLVACTHVSNILGTIHDVEAIAKKVHTVPGALLAVDGVAHAPHRAINVKRLSVDFYTFSWYKVYGPHVALLYASDNVLPKIRSLGHYFNNHDSLQDKLGLAGSSYELTQSIPQVLAYFSHDPAIWDQIAAHEEKLSAILLDFLNTHPKVTVRGEPVADSKLRVPTISFTVEGRSSKAIIEEVDSKSNLGFRWGHFYSKRLVNDILGLDDEGVVRVSAVHYNTVEEMQQVVDVLKEILG